MFKDAIKEIHTNLWDIPENLFTEPFRYSMLATNIIAKSDQTLKK